MEHHCCDLACHTTSCNLYHVKFSFSHAVDLHLHVKMVKMVALSLSLYAPCDCEDSSRSATVLEIVLTLLEMI
jgi:hypothetical protein